MSKITNLSIQKNNKNRCNIFIDGDFFIGVPIEIVYSYSLKVGQQIEKDKLKEIAIEKDKLEIVEKAVSYISKYLKTKKQLKEYLLKKGYSNEVVFYCIDKLKEYGLIDDEKYAKRYIESSAKTKGKNLLNYKLMMKGVKKQDIESAYSSLDIDSKENAKVLAEKRLKNKEITKEIISKTYRYLISKGFTYEDANYAISSFKEED